MKFEFDPIADAAYLEISDKEVESTRQIEPGIMADYDSEGHIIGIEILNISQRATPSLKQAA